MTKETIIILGIIGMVWAASNILCVCLGYWMGMVKVGQAIPAIKLAVSSKKPKSYLEDDPYAKAMADKPEERKETVA